MVFLCAVPSAAKNIPETVMEASGAAACASSIIADRRGEVIVEEELPLKDLRGLGPRIKRLLCAVRDQYRRCGQRAGSTRLRQDIAENMVYVADNLFTCSQDTAVKMAEVIRSTISRA